MPNYRITKDYFSGGGKVATGELADIIRGVAITGARVALASITDLTDNSGGAAADGTIGAITIPAAAASAAVAATGTITITTGQNPAADDTVTLNSSAITFKASGATGAQVNIGADAAATATALAAYINTNTVALGVSALAAANVVTLTANTAGTGGNSYTLAKSGTNLTVSGATLAGGAAGDCAAKATLETALGTVKDALTEIAARVVTASALVPASDLTNSIGGTTADGTIGAVTTSIANASSSLAASAGTITVLTNIRNYVATLAQHVNKLAVAAGVTPIVDNSGGSLVLTAPLAALSVDTGTAADGATANAIKSAAAAAFLTGVAASVKELATKLNAITGANVGLGVTVVAA